MEDAQVGWIAAIVVGGVAGWLAEQFMKSDMGLLMNIVLGVIGAAVASAILSFFGVHLGGWIGYLIAGFAGACLLIWIVRAVRPTSRPVWGRPTDGGRLGDHRFSSCAQPGPLGGCLATIGWHGWMKAAGAFNGLPRELRTRHNMLGYNPSREIFPYRRETTSGGSA
jgi:uncharacterized membrane protein YeaQ/YmgE (transglycosylase-associated protein family)